VPIISFNAVDARKQFARLKADHRRLKTDFNRAARLILELRDRVDQHSVDLRTQFTRIAQIQAVLDKHRLSLAPTKQNNRKA
jgi:hypothetical protein